MCKALFGFNVSHIKACFIANTGYWKYEANAGEKSLEIFRPIIESVPIPKDGISSF